MKDKHFALIRRWSPLVVALIVSILLYRNLQPIGDFVRLYNYTPPTEIARLADQTTMTDTARKLFYVNHPRIADRSSFSGACSNRGEQTIVLGCYHSMDRGIFLFDVSDMRLNGVEQVTAAHEMLHAAYDRLSSSERTRIDRMLNDYYARITDQRIRDTIAAYQVSEPHDITNEMHSIFATEIPDLTPEMDAYYAQYFSNRKAVTAYAANYQQEFSSRQDKIKTYDSQLADLKQTIDKNTATLARQEEEVATMQRQMEADRASGNMESYNSRVPIYNARIDTYNALIRTTQTSIAEYNRLVAVRNDLALEIRGLTESISSQLTPID